MNPGEVPKNIRRIALDVDKAVTRPHIAELAAAIEKVTGVVGVNITVTEIDIETCGHGYG